MSDQTVQPQAPKPTPPTHRVFPTPAQVWQNGDVAPRRPSGIGGDFSAQTPTMLRAAVILDYQNVHLTARDVFGPNDEAHDWLIHPMLFARAAVARRNQIQREGHPHAEVATVVAFRGMPHSEYDPDQHRYAAAQASQWRADGVTMQTRDLTYNYQRAADGTPVRDINGRKIVTGPGREKGIDVLCALECVIQAQRAEIDLVMLASRDTDLVPALDHVYDLHGRDPHHTSRIETLTWWDPQGTTHLGSLRPSGGRRIWNTNLDRSVATASLDRNDYR